MLLPDKIWTNLALVLFQALMEFGIVAVGCCSGEFPKQPGQATSPCDGVKPPVSLKLRHCLEFALQCKWYVQPWVTIISLASISATAAIPCTNSNA